MTPPVLSVTVNGRGVGEYVVVELRAAFAELVSLATPYPEPGRALAPVHAIFGAADLTFEGDGYLALQRLTHELVDHSLAGGGPTSSTVQGWLVYACRVALGNDLDQGFAELVRQIDEPLRSWTVLEHVRGHFALTPLRVGRCVVYGSLESIPQVGAESGKASLLTHETPAPVLVTTVLARDDESARVRARDRFDESRAILHLISDHIDGGKIGFSVLDEAGDARSSTGVEEGFVVRRLGFDATMTLGYRGLEAGAGKDPLERTDWERRVLAAARWVRRCFTTDWPSERVAAAMSALECLFVGGTGVRQRKGTAIANHVAPLVQVGGMTRDQVYAWIVELYKRRNDALHEGLWMLDDLDAARLVELTSSVLRWLHSTSTRTTTILNRAARAKRERKQSAVSLSHEKSLPSRAARFSVPAALALSFVAEVHTSSWLLRSEDHVTSTEPRSLRVVLTVPSGVISFDEVQEGREESAEPRRGSAGTGGANIVAHVDGPGDPAGDRIG